MQAHFSLGAQTITKNIIVETTKVDLFIQYNIDTKVNLGLEGTSDIMVTPKLGVRGIHFQCSTLLYETLVNSEFREVS